MTLFLLGAVLAIPTIAFGGVETSSQFVVALIACLLISSVVLRPFFDGSFSLSLTRFWLPSLLLILLTVFQLIPLPTSVVQNISPRVVESHQTMLEATVDQISLCLP